MEPETWDADKLRAFINHYGLLHKEVASAIGCGTCYISQMMMSKKPIEKFASLLTAYKNAVREAKIAECQSYASAMVRHYEEF